jgi:hypothetical protein
MLTIRVPLRSPAVVLLLAFALAACGPRAAVQAPSAPPPSSERAAPPAPPAPPDAEGVDPRWKVPPRPPEEVALVAQLETLNKEFSASYQRERDAMKAAIQTAIIVRGNGATLFKDGKLVETRRVLPAVYQNLRYGAHVPFTVYLKLSRHVDRELDAATQDDLKNYLKLTESGRPLLAQLGFTPAQLGRQQQLLDASQKFLADAITRRRVSRDELRSYARGMSLLLEQNLAEAGAAQLEALHQQVLAWRKLFSAQAWSGLYVIVDGGQQPRSGAVPTQYFALLFQDDGDHRGYPGESRRLVYREDTPGPDAPPWDREFNLLATVNLDADASEAFFSDPDRLSVEAMADGAKARLRTLDVSAVRLTSAPGE